VIGRAELAVGPNRARIRDWIAHAPPLAGATGPIRFAPNSGDPIDKQVEMAELHP
jgi:ABC-type branched-subunit amino acid transport system substrate-binding protein